MAVQVSGKRNERRAYWVQVMESFHASGETARGFCQQRGINPASFYQWRKKLAEAGAPASARSFPGFIDLGELAPATSTSRLEIRLDLGGGLMLQVVRG
ncbi:MAG: hypothetical protein RL268_2860 [Pseudomonadota bacterium]